MENFAYSQLWRKRKIGWSVELPENPLVRK